MQVHLDLVQPLDRAPWRLRERLGGPRLSAKRRNHGSVELTHSAGHVQPRAAPPPCEQTHYAGGTCAHDYPGHDHKNAEQLGGCQLAVYCEASPGCLPVWYRPRCERRG